MEKQKLNSTVVYILSVLGFLCCCVFGIGVIPSGIAYFMAKSKLNEASFAPENYDNISGMKTAKTIALIVVVVNVIYLAYSIYRISTIGWDEVMEQSRQMQEEWIKGMNEGS